MDAFDNFASSPNSRWLDQVFDTAIDSIIPIAQRPHVEDATLLEGLNLTVAVENVRRLQYVLGANNLYGAYIFSRYRRKLYRVFLPALSWLLRNGNTVKSSGEPNPEADLCLLKHSATAIAVELAEGFSCGSSSVDRLVDNYRKKFKEDMIRADSVQCCIKIWDVHRAQLQQEADLRKLPQKLRDAAAALQSGFELVNKLTHRRGADGDILTTTRVLEHACALRITLAESLGALYDDADRVLDAPDPMAAALLRFDRRLPIDRLARELKLPDAILLRLLEACAQGLADVTFHVDADITVRPAPPPSASCPYWCALTHPAVQLYLGWWLVAPMVAMSRPGCHGRGLPSRLIASSPAWLWHPRDSFVLEPALETAARSFVHALFTRLGGVCGCPAAHLGPPPHHHAPGPAEDPAAADEGQAAAVAAAAAAGPAAAAASPPVVPYRPLQMYELVLPLAEYYAELAELEDDPSRPVFKEQRRQPRVWAARLLCAVLARTSSGAAARRLQTAWRVLARTFEPNRTYFGYMLIQQLAAAAAADLLRLRHLEAPLVARAQTGAAEGQAGAAEGQAGAAEGQAGAAEGQAGAAEGQAGAAGVGAEEQEAAGAEAAVGQAESSVPAGGQGAGSEASPAALQHPRGASAGAAAVPEAGLPEVEPAAAAAAAGSGPLASEAGPSSGAAVGTEAVPPAVALRMGSQAEGAAEEQSGEEPGDAGGARGQAGPPLPLPLPHQPAADADADALNQPQHNHRHDHDQQLPHRHHLPPFTLTCALESGLLPAFERELRKPYERIPYIELRNDVVALDVVFRRPGAWPAMLAHGNERQAASLIASIGKVRRRVAELDSRLDAIPNMHMGGDPRVAWRLELLALLEQMALALKGRPTGPAERPVPAAEDMGQEGAAGGSAPPPAAAAAAATSSGGADGAGSQATSGTFVGSAARVVGWLPVNHGLCGLKESSAPRIHGGAAASAAGLAPGGGGAAGDGGGDGGDGAQGPGSVLEPQWEDLVAYGGCPAKGTAAWLQLRRLTAFAAREWLPGILDLRVSGQAAVTLKDLVVHRAYRVVWSWIRVAASRCLAALADAGARMARAQALDRSRADTAEEARRLISEAVRLRRIAQDWREQLLDRLPVFPLAREVLVLACLHEHRQEEEERNRSVGGPGGAGAAAAAAAEGAQAGGAGGGGTARQQQQQRTRGGRGGRASTAAGRQQQQQQQAATAAVIGDVPDAAVVDAAMDLLPGVISVLESVRMVAPDALVAALDAGRVPVPRWMTHSTQQQQQDEEEPLPCPTGPGLPSCARVRSLLRRHRCQASLYSLVEAVAVLPSFGRTGPTNVAAVRQPAGCGDAGGNADDDEDEDAVEARELPGPAAYFPRCAYAGCVQLEGEAEADRPLRACGRCRAVSYCSDACQRADWAAGHQQRCGGPVRPRGAQG